MSAKHKYENVQIKVKKRWELSHGPVLNRSAETCTIDTRPKRMRTRKDIERNWRRDYE